MEDLPLLQTSRRAVIACWAFLIGCVLASLGIFIALSTLFFPIPIEFLVISVFSVLLSGMVWAGVAPNVRCDGCGQLPLLPLANIGGTTQISISGRPFFRVIHDILWRRRFQCRVCNCEFSVEVRSRPAA